MKRFVVVLMMLMVAVATFAETADERLETADKRLERARVERDAAWNELFNYKPMSLDEFKAEYKKNHFALNKYGNNDWSASLKRAFDEYWVEVKQHQKELWDIYYEKDAKYKKANKAWMDALDVLHEEMDREYEETMAKYEETKKEIDEILRSMKNDKEEI